MMAQIDPGVVFTIIQTPFATALSKQRHDAASMQPEDVGKRTNVNGK